MNEDALQHVIHALLNILAHHLPVLKGHAPTTVIITHPLLRGDSTHGMVFDIF